MTELLKLAPATATLVTKDGSGHIISEEEVSTALIQRGDLLKVCLAPLWHILYDLVTCTTHFYSLSYRQSKGEKHLTVTGYLLKSPFAGLDGDWIAVSV